MIDLIGWIACGLTLSSIYMPNRFKLHVVAATGCLFWLFYAISISSKQYILIESVTLVSHLSAAAILFSRSIKKDEQ